MNELTNPNPAPDGGEKIRRDAIAACIDRLSRLLDCDFHGYKSEVWSTIGIAVDNVVKDRIATLEREVVETNKACKEWMKRSDEACVQLAKTVEERDALRQQVARNDGVIRNLNNGQETLRQQATRLESELVASRQQVEKLKRSLSEEKYAHNFTCNARDEYFAELSKLKQEAECKKWQ